MRNRWWIRYHFLWHNRLPQHEYILLKRLLITALGAYNSKTARWNFLYCQISISMINSKFPQILCIEFRAPIHFQNFKVALNPMYRIFLNFAKSYVLSFLRPWQTRTHCGGHIVADTNVSPPAPNTCCGHKFCVRDTENVSDLICSETFCVRNKCFPVCAVQETSWATMCPLLPVPLFDNKSKGS